MKITYFVAINNYLLSMELKQLDYFLMLTQTLHFRKAAEKLYIVQPALSKQIKSLEEELGVRLFERSQRRVQLTPAGQYFKQEVAQIRQRLEEVRNLTQLVATGEAGEIRIGYVGSCIHTFLPEMITGLTSAFPHIQLYLSEMITAAMWEAILKGELDLAFLRNPPFHESIESTLIWQEPFALVVPETSSLNETNFRSMRQVAGESFILPTRADGDAYHDLQWSICEDAGFSPQVSHETVHGHTALQLVANQLGLAILPMSFREVTTARVRFLEIPRIRQRSEITAVWDRHNPNPSLSRLLKFILEKSLPTP